VIAAGITVHEALKAYDELEADGISARIVDAYSIKPLDEDAIRASVRATSGNALIVEDHWAEGGLGDAVLECLSDLHPSIERRVVRLAVRRMPGSGTPAEQLSVAGIDAGAIAEAARRLLADAARELEPTLRRSAEPSCYLCGRTADWRIALAGEDEPLTEEYACEVHASGHLRIAPLALEYAPEHIGH
jgi:transketolase